MFLPPGSGLQAQTFHYIDGTGPQPEKDNRGKGNISQGTTSITPNLRLPKPSPTKKELKLMYDLHKERIAQLGSHCDGEEILPCKILPFPMARYHYHCLCQHHMK